MRKIKEIVDSVTDSVNCLIVNGVVDIWKKWAKFKFDVKILRLGIIILYIIFLVKFLVFFVDYGENEVVKFFGFD